MYKKSIFFTLCAFVFSACSVSTQPQTKAKECFEAPKTGLCKAYFEKYYFNQDTNKCKKFIWGGCGGNIPFHKLEDCQKACEK